MQLLKWLGVELIEVSWLEKLVSVVGAFAAIFCVFLVTRLSLPESAAVEVIASMGATAVLLYAVPHGPLSQPWPVLGGHFFSAIIGVICAQLIPDTALATALAVGLAIGVMHQLKCIHPPGGATAFTAVMGGDAIRELGFHFVWQPVMLNSLVMLGLAIAINWLFPWRRYPASLIRRPKLSSPAPSHDAVAAHEQVVQALRAIDSFVDISEEDLLHLSDLLKKHQDQTRSTTISADTTSLDAPMADETSMDSSRA